VVLPLAPLTSSTTKNDQMITGLPRLNTNIVELVNEVMNERMDE
jgi:hypothetical protein